MVRNARPALAALAREGISLTIVDVGASLEPFPPFRPLLGVATYVGFDPDRRELHTSSSAAGRRIVIDKALVADDRSTARFFLTRNPTASSTLPVASRIEEYLPAYRYEVVGDAEVPATTLDKALASVGLDRVDWIKLDTQGTDLRLIESLSDGVAATLMAVDAEPGIDAFYEGEDTFGDLHRAMVERGYWLADLSLDHAARLRRSTYDATIAARTKLGRVQHEFALKRSPIAAGPRYLRTIESLDEGGAKRDDFVRLWACATFSGNDPFALEVVMACQARYGADGLTDELRDLSIRRNRSTARRRAWRLVEKVNVRNLKRFVTKPY